MAGLAPVSLRSDGEESYPESPQVQVQPASPSGPGSSDKENRNVARARLSPSEKRRKFTQGLSSQTQSTPMSTSGNGNKKRRLTERGLSDQGGSQAVHRRRLQKINDTDYYDPDQDEGERRRVRKGLRDLTRELNDCRGEYLQSDSNGILETVKRADGYFQSVKQTSDATIDSRLLVTAADLSYRKATQLALGDGSAALDVDEFVSKCISYMRRGAGDQNGAPSTSSQRRRHRASGLRDDNDAEGEGDEGDALDWEYLGRKACIPYNKRPGLSGFLLGPLSIQKRTRQVTQRRARQERIDPTQVVRPNELQDADLDKKETANLTQLCAQIRETLMNHLAESEEKASEELSQAGELTENEKQEVMDKYGIADDGGISLFRFCINPRSFGQTVENLFYVSFLIRDGYVGVFEDSNHMPTLHGSDPHGVNDARTQSVQKHQAIFSLDFETFEDLIEVFGIQEPIIPPRDEQDAEARKGAISFWKS